MEFNPSNFASIRASADVRIKQSRSPEQRLLDMRSKDDVPVTAAHRKLAALASERALASAQALSKRDSKGKGAPEAPPRSLDEIEDEVRAAREAEDAKAMESTFAALQPADAELTDEQRDNIAANVSSFFSSKKFKFGDSK